MKPAGRPPTPKHVKMAQGTYRKDRDKSLEVKGDKIESVPDLEFKNQDAKRFFHDTCQILIDNGWMLRDFVNDVERASYWYGLYCEHKDEPSYQLTKTGYSAMTAHFSITKEAHKNLCDFENRYGLNLLYAQRFEKKENKEEDPFHKLLNAK